MSFDVAAEAYDSFMGRYSRPARRALRRRAHASPPAGRALDVGCGPGALIEELAGASARPRSPASIRPRASSPPRRRATRGPTSATASPSSLPFDDDTFDADARRARRALHDGCRGRRPRDGARHPPRRGRGRVRLGLRRRPRAADASSSPRSASVVTGIDDESHRVGARAGDLGALLRGAGCTAVEESELTVAVDYATFDEWWTPYTLGVSPAGQAARRAPGAGARRRARPLRGAAARARRSRSPRPRGARAGEV